MTNIIIKNGWEKEIVNVAEKIIVRCSNRNGSLKN